MATYTNLLFHIVFSTKNRHPSITPEIRQPTYQYIGGILRAEGATLLEIGGIDDHVHLLARLKPTLAVADAVRVVKSNSSRWLNQEVLEECFRWQTGYGAFTVTRSSVPAVRRYIRNQERHHRNWTFQDEFRDLLEKSEIEYDEQYVWD
jgi:REP element-mobilizing transposase RayT